MTETTEEIAIETGTEIVASVPSVRTEESESAPAHLITAHQDANTKIHTPQVETTVRVKEKTDTVQGERIARGKEIARPRLGATRTDHRAGIAISSMTEEEEEQPGVLEVVAVIEEIAADEKTVTNSQPRPEAQRAVLLPRKENLLPISPTSSQSRTARGG